MSVLALFKLKHFIRTGFMSSKHDQSVDLVVILVHHFLNRVNVEIHSMSNQNFLFIVISSSVQKVVTISKIPFEMEDNLMLARFFVGPGESGGLVLVKAGRGESEKLDLLTDVFYEFLNLFKSHTSSSV